MRYRQFLANLLRDGQISAVYFEEVRRHIGTDAAHIYGGMLAILSYLCEGSGIPYIGVPVGTIKRHATGRGNASKEAVIEAMRAKGHNPETHDEADALAIAYFALDQTEGNHDQPIPQGR